MRILFVENHARFARLATKQFLFEHTVTFVASLRAAREVLDQNFEIVLIDYDLDDGKGDALVRELKIRVAKFPICYPKIIAISAHQLGNGALLAAGADAVCGKMQFSEIAQIIGTLL